MLPISARCCPMPMFDQCQSSVRPEWTHFLGAFPNTFSIHITVVYYLVIVYSWILLYCNCLPRDILQRRSATLIINSMMNSLYMYAPCIVLAPKSKCALGRHQIIFKRETTVSIVFKVLYPCLSFSFVCAISLDLARVLTPQL